MIALLASLLLSAAPYTGDTQYDYILDCMAVDMPYEHKKGMNEELIPIFSALHCQCMLQTMAYVGQMGGGTPEWMRPDINKNCRKKTRELLTPKPQKKCR